MGKAHIFGVFLEDLAGLQKLTLPDRWQAEAVAGLIDGEDVVVDAPTGAGKTFVFEKFMEKTNFSRRAVYTVPTRALANDKFAEWTARGWDTGIMTGDIAMNTRAGVVVATLEAVQNLPFENAGVELLVIDEYQWLGDPLRGNHYEGVLMAFSARVRYLFLSGTVDNPGSVASWLARMGRATRVVRHRERPVPLEEVDANELARYCPASVKGYWAKRVAGALREDLGPVLLFAPHRREAERLARQLAREIPLAQPLGLTAEQESVLGPKLTRLLRNRVAYHHSGLSYTQRAGIIEPLAKAGQLRAVVATLGLSAGINFSLRSVMITAHSYRHQEFEHRIQPHELMQMTGRAGRRGIDETGYLLCTDATPRLSQARPQKLKRAAPFPWAFFLRGLHRGATATELAPLYQERLFTEKPPRLGVEETGSRTPEAFPCGVLTDTGRARLVRRKRRPFKGCHRCTLRQECLTLSPEPTLLWQWTRIGVLDKQLRLTRRGGIVRLFLGPEGLALAAALEDRKYPLDDLVFDIADLFGGERFRGTNPRWMGRLAGVCRKAYHRFSVEGYLFEGVPPQYGYGAADVVREIVEHRARRSELAVDFTGRGDIDRLLTEWRGFLRQTVQAPPTDNPRFEAFRDIAAGLAARSTSGTLPPLPPLTAEQREPARHRFFEVSRRTGT